MNVQASTKTYFIGNVDDFPVKLGRDISIDGVKIAVFKLESGQIKAIQNKCPHKGGPLAEGIVSGEHVFCPLHDWKISLQDGMVQYPDEGCVTTFKTTVTDGKVYVHM
ncbi:nitrite reductase small subunit NirD [Halalkalibacterium halodurans]|jgi:nitrite reductase (NADH) small subunit|uniref:Assimilatory nitrite reductase (Subunit) n=1 Tax=Halalkalibacterium halodurans (strain ATCC BAA-125 / DSM 18197 / FERM 7344 / JCM 9153 / C-125) TaxID=272558 RepID=Q9KF72_HALH5|nr:nitrite reductase small subunit NirD [Halalkalibacterium halodurans]MDY7221108.1 nitrite reductase small subunit NirD [Halalkalibacterium halodurans]MDY7240347.1 nitrite reductase small subunit NirD [Halalkalibacterium halodurans]MED4082757.1 nitrite reductase small subunit NirD [Halalkalibacterium halodurans]MED4086683.1 nitrite reductase small subunit NirD [Halalkalibacterium halodurans]MED4103259.1 nitrite reductase small subunit NirD [Halalkalibacterium halodurans]